MLSLSLCLSLTFSSDMNKHTLSLSFIPLSFLIHIHKPSSTYMLSFPPLLYLYLSIRSLTGKLHNLIKIHTRLRRYRELNNPLRGKLRPQYLASWQTSTHIDTAASLKTVSLVKLCFKIKSLKGGIVLPTGCPDSSLQRQKEDK